MTQYKDIIVNFIKDYFEKNGNSETKAVIGISGGKDSTVVAAACVEALGKDRVVGVLMPNGTQKDISDSYEVVKFLGIEHYEINIGDAFEGLTNQITRKLGKTTTPQYSTNTPARLRMATLYGVAAMIGNCRVSCNGNKSECELGYFTLWGDSAGDFAPLSKLYVSEVIQAGLELGLPEHLVKKAPQDGMCGKTDEENLGFTYDEVEKVLKGVIPQNKKIADKIESVNWKKKLLRGIPTISAYDEIQTQLLRKPEKVLVIVDPQKDFIDGSLGVGLEKWIPARNFIIDQIKNGGYQNIIVTKDWHPSNHCSFKEYGGQWPTHCVMETEGAMVDPEILKAINEVTSLTLKRNSKIHFLTKGIKENKEEYGCPIIKCGNVYVTTGPIQFDVVGLCLDYCVKETANGIVKPFNNNDIDIVDDYTKPTVRILKRGTVAINPDAPLDLEDGVELVED